MENQEAPNPKYLEVKEHFKNVLKTGKKLGLHIRPGGGYAMGYDMNRLPPYPVGLFGVLSIIEGQGARCKLGLTFDETAALEAGFNGSAPRVKKKTKNRTKAQQELMLIGAELRQYIYKEPKRSYSTAFNKNFIDDFQPEGVPAILAAPAPMVKAKSPFGPQAFADAIAFVNEPADQAVKAKKKEKLLGELAAGLKEKIAKDGPDNEEEQVKFIVAEALKNKDIAKQLVKLADAMNIPQPANLPQEWIDNDDNDYDAGEIDEAFIGDED